MTIITNIAAGRTTKDLRKSNAARRPIKSVIQDRIERAAFALLINENNLSDDQSALLEAKLTRLLLEYKGLKAFATGDVEEDSVIQDKFNAQGYSGVEFVECFNFAKKRYREEWAATNGFKTEYRPFLMFFNYLYKLKSNDIKSYNADEKNYWDRKIKIDLLSSLLRRVKLNSTYKGYLPEINVLNIDKLVERLTLFGASEVDIADAKKIYGGNYLQQDPGSDDDGEEPDCCAYDFGGYSRFRNRDLAMMYIADLLEQAKKDAVIQGEKMVVANMDFYVTLKSRFYMTQQFNIDKVLLHDFLDLGLLDYVSGASEVENDTQLFSDFTHCKYDTARKKLRKVQLWLEKWFCHQQAA